MNLSFKTIVAVVVLLGLLLLMSAGIYTVQMTEQAIVTQFGKPVGAPITAAGLHFKTPFIQDVNFLEKRVMEWDGNANQIPTKDKLFIYIDSYARWRISEPLLFFQRLHDERSAQSRLDDILDGETRNQVAKHELIEIIRTDKNRQPAIEETMTSTSVQVQNWAPIRFGREQIARDIFTNASKTLPVAIAEFSGRYTTDFGLVAAGGLVAALPPVLIALAFQRNIVSGMSAGAIKG